MPAEQDIQVVRDNVAAFSAGDWDRFRATMTADAVYHELGTQRRVQGPDQIVEIARTWRQAFPDTRGTITHVVASGNTVVAEITWEGTQTGALVGPGGTLPASGKTV